MRSTIRDVARLAGVSTSTVSFVLNNKPVPISQETRDAVLNAAKELHYRPNQLAVGLVTNKTNTLGLIIPDNSNPFFANLSNQVEKYANQNGYSVILGNTNNSAKATRDYLRIFTDHGVDGILLAQADFESSAEGEKCMELIKALRVPVLLADRVFKADHVNSVIVDQQEAGYLATRHLLNLGHRRIGCATGPLGLNNCQNRLAGYRAALEEYGVPYDAELIFEENLDVSCGAHALPVLLGKGVTAIFAFNDLIAYGIYKEVHSYHLSIPGDLSVVGLDDIFLSEILQPPLTTVAQPVTEMAENAVERLISQIDAAESYTIPEPLVLQPILKVRGSTTRYREP